MTAADARNGLSAPSGQAGAVERRTEALRGQDGPRVYGGLVFVPTCRSHPEQYDVLAEGGQVVGYVHYRRGVLTIGGPGYLDDPWQEPLLQDERESASEWPDNRIADDHREAWLTEAAELVHAALRRERAAS